MCKECLIRDGISLAQHWWAITREPANLTGGLLSPAITSTTDQSKRAPGEEQREIYNIVADLSHLGGLPLGIFTTDTIEDLLCSSEEREGLSNGSISVLGIGHHSKPSILRRTKRKIVFGRDNKVRGWWNDLFRGTISFWAAWQPASSVALSLPTDNVQERSYFYWPPSTCIPLWCWMEIKELEFFTDISFQ